MPDSPVPPSAPPSDPASPTPWLSPAESRAWRSFLLASQLLMDQLDRELQHAADMPHTYYGILVVLSEQPERSLRMTEIADVLRFSKSRLTHAIGRLEERGWVQRVVCPTDRRGTFAVLTEAGHAALAAAAPGHVAGVRRHLFERLTPEQVEQLRKISDQIAGPLLPAACDGKEWPTGGTGKSALGSALTNASARVVPRDPPGGGQEADQVPDGDGHGQLA